MRSGREQSSCGVTYDALTEARSTLRGQKSSRSLESGHITAVLTLKGHQSAAEVGIEHAPPCTSPRTFPLTTLLNVK